MEGNEEQELFFHEDPSCHCKQEYISQAFNPPHVCPMSVAGDMTNQLNQTTVEGPSSVMISGLSVNDILPRIRYFPTAQAVMINLEGIHIRSSKDIEILRIVAEQVLEEPKKEYEKLTGKVAKNFVNGFVNYDDFTLDHDALIEEFSDLAKYWTDHYYKTVHRYTTSNLFDNVKKLELKLKLKKVTSAEIQTTKVIDNRYYVKEMIGEGTFATVFKATDIQMGRNVAVKCIHNSNLRALEGFSSFVKREIDILKIVQHPNIVQFVEHIETDEMTYIIMEFIASPPLSNIIEKNGEHHFLSEGRAKYIFKQLVDAFQYLQNIHHIVHRDIQDTNICVDESDHVKIIDFGCSDFFEPGNAKHNSFCGNVMWVPPEVILQKFYVGPEVDVWSLGVCLWRMVTGYLPFQNAQKVILTQFMFDIDQEHNLSSDCKDLLKRILVRDPSKRLKLEDIKQHPFMKN